jgi:hypothetical protein
VLSIPNTLALVKLALLISIVNIIITWVIGLASQ